jgi:hypothetical protein
MDRWWLTANDPGDDGGGEGNPHGEGSGDGYPPIGDDDD